MKKIAILLLALVLACRKNQDEAIYTCPMHPEYISNRPGKCPICHMELIKKEVNSKKTSQSQSIYLNEQERKELNINYARVQKKYFSHILYLPGQVAFDLELYNALLEYSQTLSFTDANFVAIKQAWENKLRQLGLTKEEILLFKKGLLKAESFIQRDNSPYALVYLQVYESDLAFVKRNDLVKIQSRALGGTTFSGEILGISEILNNQSRTFTVRARVYDPERKLKPQMYVEGQIVTQKHLALAIPHDALIDTGLHQIVFVLQEDGHLTPQKVAIGKEINGFVEVTHGLKENQWVATGAVFLLDSERQIRSFGSY